MFPFNKKQKIVKCSRCAQNYLREVNHKIKQFNTSNSNNPKEVSKEVAKLQHELNKLAEAYSIEDNYCQITEEGE